MATPHNKRGPVDPELKATMKQDFLNSMAKDNIVTLACQKAGITRQTYHNWRMSGYITEEELQEAREAFHDRLRRKIQDLALEGENRLVISNGRIVRDNYGRKITVKNHDARLLATMAQRLLPEYQERRQTQEADGIPPLQSRSSSDCAKNANANCGVWDTCIESPFIKVLTDFTPLLEPLDTHCCFWSSRGIATGKQSLQSEREHSDERM